LNDEIEKKNQLKKCHKKQLKSTWVNPLSTIFGSWGRNNMIENKQNKSYSLILIQLNIKLWNWKKLIKKNNLNQPG
jgi:hypothetical protein